MPSPGLVRGIRPASGPGIRDDGGVLAGYTVPVFYDSLIAKLIAWADTRDGAIARMTRALEEYEVLGIRTTIPFFLWLMREPDFQAARFDTTYLDRLLASRRGDVVQCVQRRGRAADRHRGRARRDVPRQLSGSSAHGPRPAQRVDDGRRWTPSW